MTAGLEEVARRRPCTATTSSRPRSGASIDLGVAIDTNAEVYDFLRTVSARYGIGLGTGERDHPPGRARELRLPRRDDDRHRQPHAQRRRPGHGGDRRRRRRCGRRDDRASRSTSAGRRSSASSSPARCRAGRAQGRDPRGGPRPHRRGRHRGDHRVPRSRRRLDLGHRQGDRSATWAPRSARRRRCSRTTPTWPPTSRPPAARRSPTPPTRSPSTCIPTTAALYDQLVEIDLDELKPMINGPHSPDRAHRVGAEVGRQARRGNGWPLEISSALIGSCTNSSYEDITRAASIARQAAAKGLTAKTELSGHAGLRADPSDDRARRAAGRPRGRRRHGAGQRLRPVHRPVVSARQHYRPSEHDRQLVQPQLPEAQRRLGEDAQLRHVARHGDGAGAGRPPRLRSHRRTR